MDQLRNLLAGFNLFQRISIAVGALLAAAAIIGITHYRTESDFRPLYTSMAPEDAAPVVQKLRESGVEFRLADNGGSVLVHSDKLAESRLTLAGAGLPKSGRIGFELFDKTSFGATELVEHINYQRALEGELERSVMSMAEVVQARVHLTLTKESVFLDQQQPAKASVMIKIRPGAQISPQNVLAVTNLVASAVDGLSPDAVAVLDMDGNLLNRPRRSNTDDSAVTSEALEVRRQIEHDLVNKINSTLEPLLGVNKFRAGASVDYDLTSGDQQEETFDPDKSVMVSSSKSEDDNQRASSAGGVPGTQANLPHPPSNGGGGGSGSHRVESITYQSSRVIRHTRIPQGVIRRMSLSVLVGQEARWEGDAKNRHRVYVSQPPETLQKIKDLVGGVTGFSAERGDQLIVETLPFESTTEAVDPKSPSLQTPKQAAPEPPWMQVLDRYRNQIVAVLVGLALFSIALRIIGVRRRGPKDQTVEILREIEAAAEAMPQPVPSKMAGNATGTMTGPANIIDSAVEAAELTADGKALLGEGQEGDAERIRQLAQRDMTATANVLRMWLDQKA
jgi:flagellar M-ring protein FliF